jgi:hypothetical protein
MHMRQADGADVDAPRGQRRTRELGRDARIGVMRVEHVLGRRAAADRRTRSRAAPP